ncbi:hypothetical protein D9M68_614400 [compost metagenome]
MSLYQATLVALPVGASEGTFAIAEQFAVDQGFRNSGAVEGNEGTIPTITFLMDSFRQRVFAHAGFTEQHDRQTLVHDLPYEPDVFLHLPVITGTRVQGGRPICPYYDGLAPIRNVQIRPAITLMAARIKADDRNYFSRVQHPDLVGTAQLIYRGARLVQVEDLPNKPSPHIHLAQSKAFTHRHASATNHP